MVEKLGCDSLGSCTLQSSWLGWYLYMRLTAEIQISKNPSNTIPVTHYFPLSSLPTPFKVQRFYPYLVASVAMRVALTLGKGRDRKHATAKRLSSKEICPGVILFSIPESSWSMHVAGPSLEWQGRASLVGWPRNEMNGIRPQESSPAWSLMSELGKEASGVGRSPILPFLSSHLGSTDASWPLQLSMLGQLHLLDKT